MNIPYVDKRRHLLLTTYVSITICLVLLYHYFFDLDQFQAIGSAVGVYIGLLLLNYRVILTHIRTE